MSSSDQQNKTHLRTVVNFALLAGITAGFAWACVSSGGDNNGTGGTGGESATGGANAGTGGSSSVACTFTDKLVTGNICSVNPGIFALNSTCAFGDWNMSNNVLSGGLAAWSGLTADCTTGDMHVTGSYGGALVPNAGGNAGFNTFYNAPGDAGIGCSIVDASSFQGLTIDINNVTIPNNQLIVGVNLANGNAAETTLTLTAGKQSKQIPWTMLAKKALCGPAIGSNIAGIYYVFPWLNDADQHTVDATFSKIGFY